MTQFISIEQAHIPSGYLMSATPDNWKGDEPSSQRLIAITLGIDLICRHIRLDCIENGDHLGWNRVMNEIILGNIMR